MLIRKTQQPSDYPENQIHDAYSTSTTDTYSCNYINHKYLTAMTNVEQNIPNGTWVKIPLIRIRSQTNVPTSKLSIENGKVKIGTGINHVRVSGGVFFQGMGNNTYVSAGDLIEISANTSNASGVTTRAGANNTWLLVEILD